MIERVWPGRDPPFEPLGGGITNRNFKVAVDGEAFVLRIGGKDTELLGIDRRAEQAAARMAAGIGVGPEVYAVVEPEGYLVTRFIEGRPVPPELMRSPETIEQLAPAFRAIHEGPPIPGRFDSHRVVESYATELLRSVDMTGVREAALKVVVDCAGGTASLVLPELLGRIGVDVLTVNNRLDEASPTQSLAQLRAGMQRLSELVASARAAFGVRFDQVGERIQLVDDKGAMVSDDRALLVVLDLIAAERRAGQVALPVTTTRVAERVKVVWTPTSLHGLTEATAADDVIFGADGRGGYVVPEFSRTLDGIAVFALLLGLVARTRLTVSQIDARIPRAHLLKRSMPTPWAAKGSVMRTVVEAAAGRTLDTTDGVRVVEPDGGWVLVLPDPADAVTHLWAEGADADAAQALLDE